MAIFNCYVKLPEGIQPETGVANCSPGDDRPGLRAQHASHPFHGAQDGAMQNHRASVARRKSVLRPDAADGNQHVIPVDVWRDILIWLIYG